jgi:hypothetical protein
MKQTNNPNWFKISVALIVSAYFLWCAYDPSNWHFIDSVNLFVHEGGHVIFSPFGMFLYVLGGSLTQVLLPLLFVIYFYFQQQYFSAALTLFWVGENLLSVAVYAGDAVRMQLPLLFGDNSIHDWNWLLIYTGQLHHTTGIALTIRLAGTLVIAGAAAWSLILTFTE